MRLLIALAKDKNIPIITDPKSKDWNLYQGVDLITPNKAELELAGGKLFDQESIINSTRSLLDKHSIKAALVTLSEDGMIYIDQTNSYHQESLVNHIINVSGAGDHVIAMMAIALSLELPMDQSLLFASELTANHIEQGQSNIISLSNTPWDMARAQIIEWQRLGLKVGFTNGCFDILHAGHVMYLNQTKSYCDKLVLGLNSDVSVRLLKGETRPINPEHDRSDVMMGLKAVDHVVLFGAEKIGDDNTPSEVIAYLKPDIFFKGGDYTIDQLPEANAVLAYGGEVKILGVLEGRSTTNIIQKSKV
jgi:D-beta-D-heptose 7-phosphate kinase/D-beta-D-heptose 1-phosphate adenosyltransferase